MTHSAHDIIFRSKAIIKRYRYLFILLLLLTIVFSKVVSQLLLLGGVILIAGYVSYKALLYSVKISYLLLRVVLWLMSGILAVSGLVWVIGHL